MPVGRISERPEAPDDISDDDEIELRNISEPKDTDAQNQRLKIKQLAAKVVKQYLEALQLGNIPAQYQSDIGVGVGVNIPKIFLENLQTSGIPTDENFLRGDFTWTAPESSPLTTKGDVYGFSTVNAKIPVGANGEVLTADSAVALGVKWAIATATAVSSWKPSVRVATTTAQTLATDFENGDTIDGIVLATGNRILIKNQAAGADNGIYTVNASGAPTRATDFDNASDLISNAVCMVQEGTANLDKAFQCTTNEPITIGTTALVFAEFGAGGGGNNALLDGSVHNDTLAGTVTRGDIIVGNATPKWAELALGTATKRLQSDGIDASWAWPKVTTYTANQTLADTDEIVLINPATTAMTITLPAASGRAGKYYKLIYISTTGQPVTIDGNASETINGSLTLLMENRYDVMELYCDGTNWFAIYSSINVDNYQNVSLDEEFMGGAVTTAAGGVRGNYSWAIAGVATETIAYFEPASKGHLGCVRIGTSAVSGDDCDIILGEVLATTVNILWLNENHSTTFLIKINGTLANGIRRAGLFLNAVSNSEETNENECFLFDTAVSAKWRARTRSSGGIDQTTTDGGADVVVDTWYKLKIVRDGSTVRFYVNDVNIANHSTQVPTNPATPAFTVDATSAAARTLDIDKFSYISYLGSRLT